MRIAGGREVHLRSLQPLGLLLANSIFAGDSERCVVTSMCFAPRRIENEHSIVFVGYYIDTCVKADGRWQRLYDRWIRPVMGTARKPIPDGQRFELLVQPPPSHP